MSSLTIDLAEATGIDLEVLQAITRLCGGQHGITVLLPATGGGLDFPSARELGVLEEPRELLSHVEELNLLDWENEELCCGFGGTFAVKMPDVSTAMADEKIKALDKSGADTLSSGDSSCLMHLEGRLRRTGHDTRVLHLAEVLDAEIGKAG